MYEASDELRPCAHGARLLEGARRELRVCGRGEVMCSVQVPLGLARGGSCSTPETATFV